MMGNTQPHFAASIEAIRDGMFRMERTLMRSAELRQVLKYQIRVNPMAEKDALIGGLTRAEPFLSLDEEIQGSAFSPCGLSLHAVGNRQRLLARFTSLQFLFQIRDKCGGTR